MTGGDSPAPDAARRDFGVALSGGGVRASAFALGALLYLVDSGLNRRVATISSVSGASLTNGFVLTRADDFGRLDRKSFNPIAEELIRRLRTAPVMGGTTLLVYALLLISGLCGFSVAFWAWPFDAPPPVRFAVPFAWATAALLRGRLIESGIERFLRPVAGAGLTEALALLLLVAGIGWLGAAAGGALLSVASWDWRLGASSALVAALFLLGATHVLYASISDRQCLGRNRPADATTHVFCSTDLVTQSPLFLVDHGGGWVYSRYGWAGASSVPLATALRASAALPGAFPPRALPTSLLDPISDEFSEARLPWWLHLSDGGVWDNLGTQWFGPKGPPPSTWADVTAKIAAAPRKHPAGEEDIRCLLVVDGRGFGTGFTHRSARLRSALLKVPLLSEVRALLGASSIQYENTVEPRTRAYWDLLRLQLEHPAPGGVLAAVATLTSKPLQPVESELFNAVAQKFPDASGKVPGALDPDGFHGLSPAYQALGRLQIEMKTLLDKSLSAAQPVWLSGTGSVREPLSRLHERSARVWTKLWWLSKSDTMALVIHGYIQAMGAASALIAVENGKPGAVHLNFPGLDRFEALAENS